MILNVLVAALVAVIKFAPSVQTKKIIKIGITALKNMVSILVFALTIVLMITVALPTVFQNTKIKLKIALVRFNIFHCSLAPS